MSHKGVYGHNYGDDSWLRAVREATWSSDPELALRELAHPPAPPREETPAGESVSGLQDKRLPASETETPVEVINPRFPESYGDILTREIAAKEAREWEKPASNFSGSNEGVS